MSAGRVVEPFRHGPVLTRHGSAFGPSGGTVLMPAPRAPMGGVVLFFDREIAGTGRVVIC